MASNYYENESVLKIPGYDIYFTRFSDSIIVDHFADAIDELETILGNFYIQESQIIEGGGGKSSITQALETALKDAGWIKEKIESEHHVRGKVLTSESHEVDHYKEFEEGNIGLEIEWNNKDPFYDRDLENFRKLHQIGEMSVGIIITRGESLQEELYYVFSRFLNSIYPFTIDDLIEKLSLSVKASKRISKFIGLPKDNSIEKIANDLYKSKYGTATTHMSKLLLRIDRGVGNPCPCVLIGIGADRLTK
ncbi:MAG: BglII/BstYI family type II restriction endonuclease [Bacteroidota bacterium]